MGRIVFAFTLILIFTAFAVAENGSETNLEPKGTAEFLGSNHTRAITFVAPIHKWHKWEAVAEGRYYGAMEGDVVVGGVAIKSPKWYGFEARIGTGGMGGHDERLVPAFFAAGKYSRHLPRDWEYEIKGSAAAGLGNSLSYHGHWHHNTYTEMATGFSWKGWGGAMIAERFHHREIEWKWGMEGFKKFKNPKIPTFSTQALWPGKLEVRGGVGYRF